MNGNMEHDGRMVSSVLILSALFLLIISCARSSENQERVRLNQFLGSQRLYYAGVIELENRVVQETATVFEEEPDPNPHSSTWNQMKRISQRWAAVHVEYRWLAQNLSREIFYHPKIRRAHERILAHLIDRQYRALKFEKLSWQAYRSVLLSPVPVGIPSQMEEMRQQLPKHPPAIDRISGFLAE